jgi:hypothetical protein
MTNLPVAFSNFVNGHIKERKINGAERERNGQTDRAWSSEQNMPSLLPFLTDFQR